MTASFNSKLVRPTSFSLQSARPVRLYNAVTLSLCAVLASQVTTVRGQTPQCGLQSRQIDPSADPEAVWRTITPGTVEDLSWTPCYPASNFTQLCSKLIVPLDYAHPEGESAVIALLKIPAVVNLTDAEYRGPILFNPGGPGHSGIDYIIEAGSFFQQLIGNEFDIVGFDPRGVGRTVPQVNIFPDQSQNAAWQIPAFRAPLYNATPDAVPRMYASSRALASVAAARINNTAPYLSTAQVARDMLKITNAFGRDKLQYWGFSYGTALGETFAAMFPDKVERLIIDGVLDGDDYFTTSWMKNLLDTDKGWLNVLQECVDIGPDVCALHEGTVEQVHARITKILDDLKANPIAVESQGDDGPLPDYGIFEYSLAKTFLFEFLYSPYDGTGPAVMSALRALENGDARPFWDMVVLKIPQYNCRCPAGAPTIQTPNAITAISCSDGLPVNDTAKDLDKVFQDLTTQSEFGDVWNLRAACVGWKFRPVERFSGPFVGNTSHPILLIGNTADPATPLVNAHTMSKGFNGSVVLTQNSGGHASTAAVSLCTSRAIRDYFREGTLPKEGTICEIDSTVFNGTNIQDGLASRNLEEISLVEAWHGWRRGLKPPVSPRGLLF